jgi:hypothetical protein
MNRINIILFYPFDTLMVSNFSIFGASEMHVLIGTHSVRSESLVWFIGSWDGTPWLDSSLGLSGFVDIWCLNNSC